MKLDRPTAVSAVALLGGSSMFVLASWAMPAAAARAGVPPYCVLTGGPRGPGSLPQICRYFDYQQCLQAAAELRGNCVVNIDYHGDISMRPTLEWSRRRR